MFCSLHLVILSFVSIFPRRESRAGREGMTQLFSTDNLTSLLPSLLHDLLFLCSFLACHPLILAYFLLLSPYLLKLIFFLYPLLFSTSLLLLALLTVSSQLRESPSSSSDFPGSTCSAVLNILQVGFIADEAKASSTEQLCSMVLAAGDYFHQMVQNDAHFFYISADFKENYSSEHSEENECSEHRPEERDDKEEEGITKTTLPWRKEHRRGTSGILRRDGSARKEKEWKRTLACKLFEERMTYRLCEDRKAVEGAEGMDLLWEAYEVDAGKAGKQRRKEKREKKKKEEEEDDEYDEEGLSGRPCCLKALRFSAGKMNLGMGRPSLVKVSMALKGMALFHPVVRRSKRV